VPRDCERLDLPGERTVSYAIYGDPDGRPVVALHGAPACRLMFAAADEAARAKGLRILAPDRPGYGLTRADRKPTLASRTDWLVAVVDALGLERFALLAVSGGSPYAVALAERLGERVSALALVSPMGPIADYSESAEAALEPVSFFQDRFFMHMPYRTWLTHPLGDVGAWMFRHGPDMFAGLLPKLAPDADARILAKPEVARVMRDMTLEAFRQGGGGGTADLEIYGRPWGVRFQDVTAPAVMWQGTADTIVPPQVATWLASQLPRCTFHRLDEAGHFWVFEHVGEVVAGLSDLMSHAGAASKRVP
jgi:pimeloyl-ACP methyl ester carboxylesterase